MKNIDVKVLITNRIIWNSKQATNGWQTQKQTQARWDGIKNNNIKLDPPPRTSSAEVSEGVLSICVAIGDFFRLFIGAVLNSQTWCLRHRAVINDSNNITVPTSRGEDSHDIYYVADWKRMKVDDSQKAVWVRNTNSPSNTRLPSHAAKPTISSTSVLKLPAVSLQGCAVSFSLALAAESPSWATMFVGSRSGCVY